jgi:hypothetical protein
MKTSDGQDVLESFPMGSGYCIRIAYDGYYLVAGMNSVGEYRKGRYRLTDKEARLLFNAKKAVFRSINS